MTGGLWLTNDACYGWQSSLTDWHPGLESNRLLIQLDRALITNNLWIAVAVSSESNATLLAGLFDTQLLHVADPVVLHVTSTSAVDWPAAGGVERPAMSGVEWHTNTLELISNPTASVIALSTTNGLMRIYCTALLPISTAVQSLPSSTSVVTPATRVVVAADGVPSGSGSSLPIVAISTALTPSVTTPGGTPDAPPGLATGARTWYVNADTGDDVRRDGSANENSANSASGPKRTIAAGLANAMPGDTLVVAAGTYSGRVKLDGIRMITNGRVVLP
ncbi:MAG: hypothetical protein ACOYOU_01435 [Kiritimatiellia bacterium]